jgi:hypothetical protein
MVEAAEYGFMLRDGVSKGDADGVINMIRQTLP